MSYLPHKVPQTSLLFSSFRESPSTVRMADNPAYDGEEKKIDQQVNLQIPGEKGGGGGTTGFLSVGKIWIKYSPNTV